MYTSELLKALTEFEEKNKTDVRLRLFSDGSVDLVEFIGEEEFGSFESLELLIKFLKK